MSPDRDPRFPPSDSPDEPEEEFEEEEAPRSIFSATWFRIVLVLLGVAVVGAVAVPYVLDVVNPTIDGAGTRTVVTPAPAPPTPEKPTPAPAPPTPAKPAPTPPTSVTPAPAPPTTAKPAPAPPTTSTPAPAPPTTAKPAPQAPPSGTTARTAPTPTPPPTATAPPSEGAGRTAVAPAPKPADKAPAVVAEAPKPAPPKAPAARTTPRATPSDGGEYFVQVGAFKDPDTAKRVAARLREQNYSVDESVKRVGGTASAPAAARPAPRAQTPAGPDRYDVIVSGGSVADINTKLAAKGLASEPAGDGVRIRPSLPLRDAVALSKDLGGEGFKVQVRRGGGASPEPAPSAAASDTGGLTLYRVRVGGYPDRSAAQAALRELQEKGFQPFIAKGRE